ncbi:cytochrome c [Pontibacter qinzhouensis]|uniref:Cytochrome c n=1 Tax=Pontibacter qinzhouensis TaxID=2603253 RepID=A0A5C8JJ75_9BACT|nr:cytochrome c [Pontibacter qinzhouensis]TXK37658.1 cytochrome c [Pontibacter qinzhouensis]
MKKAFKIIGFALVAIFVVAAAGVLYVRYALPNVDPAPALTVDKTSALVARGEYLANHVTVCIDCHSERDWTRFSGPVLPQTEGKGGERFSHEMGFPGTFYARNITSDPETGIGTWTDGEIYRAITSGVSRNGEPFFPVMPYQSYAKMTDADVRAIIAYIRTLEPIKNTVPASKADFPMNLILRTMPANYVPAPETALDDVTAKGKYLVTIGGCGDCHTPKVKGTPVEGMYLAGGMEFKMPVGTLRSANITPDKTTGIGTWTEEAFLKRFKDTATPEALAHQIAADDFNTIMPWSMYGGMEESDLRAIYRYLMSVEPVTSDIERFTPAEKAVAKK